MFFVAVLKSYVIRSLKLAPIFVFQLYFNTKNTLNTDSNFILTHFSPPNICYKTVIATSQHHHWPESPTIYYYFVYVRKVLWKFEIIKSRTMCAYTMHKLVKRVNINRDVTLLSDFFFLFERSSFYIFGLTIRRVTYSNITKTSFVLNTIN